MKWLMEYLLKMPNSTEVRHEIDINYVAHVGKGSIKISVQGLESDEMESELERGRAILDKLIDLHQETR